MWRFGPSLSSGASQNRKSIPGSIWGQEIGDGILRATRTGKKLDRPFCYSPLLYMSVPARSWFIDVFLLQDQSDRLFRAWIFLRESESGGKGCESVVVIISVRFVRRAALRVAPDSVFQDCIPNIPSTCIPATVVGGILSDSGRIDRSWEPTFLHDGRMFRILSCVLRVQ